MSRVRGVCKGGAARWALAALLAAVAPCTARAAEPEHYRIAATIARAEGRIEGQMWVRVRVGASEDRIALWLYADRLAVAPHAMEERSWRWIYPGEISTGGIEVADVRVDGARVEVEARRRPAGEPRRGRDVAGADLVVPVAPGEARSVELALRFTLRAPGRFGRIGRAGDVLSLAAPWYPLVVQGDAWWFDVPHRIEVRCEDGEVSLAGAAPSRAASLERRGPYVPAQVAPRFHELERRARGVTIVLRTTQRLYVPPPPERRGIDGLVDLAHVDVASHVEAVAAEVIDGARALGVPVPERIVLWQVPSRTELAATAPSVVLVSDRLFQIFPIDQTLDFHRRALRRALFRHLAEPLSERADPPLDRGWAADLRAVVLLDLDEARRHGHAQTPEQLLGLFAFHPAVDQLLYAPQIAFEDAYFAAIEERDPFRDDPVRARVPLSSGRRLLESARDALDEAELRRFAAMLVNARRPARAALAEAAPERAPRLPAWLGATGAPLNYRLGAIRSRRAEGGFEHTIEIHRDGAARAEPVEVLVHDAAGNTARAVWDEEGARGEVVVRTPAPFAGAILDPRHRLPQSPQLADGHPRADDATDMPWRPPILNGFLLNVLVTEALFTGLIDFALRRRYDLEHSIGFRLERTFAFTGGNLRYSYGLGPKVHNNRRMGLISAGLSFERLHEGFAGELGAWRGQLFLQGGINTVSFSLDPREGVWLSARLVGGLAVRDDGTLGGTVRGGVRGGVVLPIGLVNALVLVAGGGFTAGEALPSELQSLGGGATLRGFESDEVLGRGLIYAVAEHRFSALRDLAWNVAHLVWVREIQLAIFTGAGLVFGTTRGEDVAGGVELGGGVRVHYEYGGVQPGVLAIDVGVPLTRTDARVIQDGVLVRHRNPVGFYVGFDQYF